MAAQRKGEHALSHHPCAGRRGCTNRNHQARGLCAACYTYYRTMGRLDRFPPLRSDVSPQARYEDWVRSGLTPTEYARQEGILATSLSRALRKERERRDRLGLPWLTGWRKVING